MKLHLITKAMIALGVLAMLSACDDDYNHHGGHGASIRHDRQDWRQDDRDDRREWHQDNRDDRREHRQDHW